MGKQAPLKSLILATVLFVIGSVCLILGSLLVTGYIETAYWDRGYSLIALGAITFLPGFYVLRIYFYARKRVKGFSFAQIPDYD